MLLVVAVSEVLPVAAAAVVIMVTDITLPRPQTASQA